MSETLTLDLAGIVRESIVDGPGIRFVVFCQGCPHNCEGCHNPATHEFGAGRETSVERILAEFDKDPLLDGITLSGGEPFCQPKAMAAIAKGVKERGKTVFAFTGFTYEELVKKAESGDGTQDLLDLCDMIVDGRFVLAERDLSLRFRGSRNQRILDMQATREAGEPVLAEEYM